MASSYRKRAIELRAADKRRKQRRKKPRPTDTLKGTGEFTCNKFFTSRDTSVSRVKNGFKSRQGR
jgi:hypothetical protein